jgi:hypothetical protein
VYVLKFFNPENKKKENGLGLSGFFLVISSGENENFLFKE